tara:strand:+ start:59 stop:517 length:459 start_codon:yes stop_codon:yes gene_type:complete
MSDDVEIAYNKQDLRKITSALKAMGDEATDAAKRESSAIAEFAQGKIQQKAVTRGKAADRIASGSRVSKSSKIGELSFGFVSQKFSGGGTTKDLWGGTEFGSNKFKQFPIWSGQSPKGAGSQGWFIYPTLREIQPEIIAQWENAFDRILKEW